MKKFLSLCLAACMVLSLGVNAFAANVTETGTQTSDMTVRYGVSVKYTVIIPEDVNLNHGTFDADLSIRDALLPSNTKLDVSLSGDSYSNGTWHMTDRNDARNKLSYSIADAGTTLANGAVVLTMPAGDLSADKTLTFTLLDDVTRAGRYADSITFTVGLVDVTPGNDTSDDPTRPCEGCGKPITFDEQCGVCGCYCQDCCECA